MEKVSMVGEGSQRIVASLILLLLLLLLDIEGVCYKTVSLS